jgi:hypothetical protein
MRSDRPPARRIPTLRFLIPVCALSFLLFVPLGIPAEELYSDSGFFLELPEGFTLNDGDGVSRFSFIDPSGVLLFQILLYEPSRYAGPEAMREDIAKKLSARAESEAFTYQRRGAVMADLSFPLSGKPHRGWGLFLDGAARNAAGKPEKDVALLAYVPEERYEAYLPFILSCLDGFSVDEEARLYPGPVSQFNLPWDPQARRPADLRFGDRVLRVPHDPREGEAAQDTVEREFRVFTVYAESAPDLAPAAWARFYRMVFRETFHRLDFLSLVLQRELSGEPDERARTARLLAWTQGFRYERNPAGSDVVNPLTAAFEGRGDCDSRAVLLAILARHDNRDAILMLSVKHSHALAAFDLPGPGARFPHGGKGWLVGETTDDVALGLIDAGMADPKDWLAVEFPR